MTDVKTNDVTVLCVSSAYETICRGSKLGRNQNRSRCVSASAYLDGGPVEGALRWEAISCIRTLRQPALRLQLVYLS